MFLQIGQLNFGSISIAEFLLDKILSTLLLSFIESFKELLLSSLFIIILLTEITFLLLIELLLPLSISFSCSESNSEI